MTATLLAPNLSKILGPVAQATSNNNTSHFCTDLSQSDCRKYVKRSGCMFCMLHILFCMFYLYMNTIDTCPFF